MPTFIVKSRKISPLTTTEVEADTREKAVAETIMDVEEGGEVQIMSCEEKVPETASQLQSQTQPEPEPAS